jgi:hypothetical protein
VCRFLAPDTFLLLFIFPNMAAPESSAFRAYSKPFDTNKGSQSFTQIFDSGYIWENGSNVTQTGAWRPLFASDFAAPNISISGVTIAVDQLEAIGTSGVAYQAAISGSTAILATEATNRWQKAKTNGYSTVFNVSNVPTLVNKVQGYTKTTLQPSFIQLFDTGSAPAVGSVPDFIISVQTTNNWFLNLAEAGVQFNNGLQIVNSSTPDTYTPLGASDFIANVVYK